jgi:hypothetical protein
MEKLPSVQFASFDFFGRGEYNLITKGNWVVRDSENTNISGRDPDILVFSESLN